MSKLRKRGSRAGMPLAAVALLCAACGGASAGSTPDSEMSRGQGGPVQDGRVSSPPVTAASVACGQLFRLPAAGKLTVTGEFPTAVSGGAQGISGTVEVRSRDIVRGVVTPGADVFLVRDGRIATMPVAQDLMGIRWDLRPGMVERLPGRATLVSCAPGGGSVRPGAYELYARVVVVQDDGVRVESVGGPWPLQVN